MGIFIGMMVVNFILMTYQERTHWKRVVLLNLVSVGIYSFVCLIDPKYINEFYARIISIIIILLFFLSLKFYPSAKLFYLGVSLICFARIFGLPYNPDFGEKGIEPALIGGFYYVPLLWTYFLFFHSKKYQKILFWVLSVWVFFIFLVYMRTFFELENTLIISIMNYFNIAYLLSFLLGYCLSFIPFIPFFSWEN